MATLTRDELSKKLRTFADARETIGVFYNKVTDPALKKEANGLRTWLEGMIRAEAKAGDEPGWLERGFTDLMKQAGIGKAEKRLYDPSETMPANVRDTVIALILKQASTGGPEKAKAVEVAWNAAAETAGTKPKTPFPWKTMGYVTGGAVLLLAAWYASRKAKSVKSLIGAVT